MSFSINILDTGDNYILAQKTNVHTGYQDGIKLYSLMDITINEINTDISLNNQDEVDFILQSIGRIISYNISDDESQNSTFKNETPSDEINTPLVSLAPPDKIIPQKLKEDIQTAAKFYKIKNFWENLQFNNQKSSKYDDILTYASLLPNEYKFQSLFGTNRDKNSTDDYNIITPPIQNINSSFTLIIFNDIYNITIVSNSDQIGCPNDILKVFPEFKIIAIYFNKSLKDDDKENLNKFFNKISFPSIEEAKKKNESFKNLYNIIPQSDDDNISSNILDFIKDNNNEKNKVKRFLDWHYTLSSDQDKRMKANDLYKEITNHMCISYTDASLFKKRLAGYLIEFKLQKKRYSDAYYYYGIVPREISKLSLEEIERKRTEDKKTWFKYQPIDNTIDLFNKKINDRKLLMEKMTNGDDSIDFRNYLE